jgi:hypothetical protein
MHSRDLPYPKHRLDRKHICRGGSTSDHGQIPIEELIEAIMRKRARQMEERAREMADRIRHK